MLKKFFYTFFDFIVIEYLTAPLYDFLRKKRSPSCFKQLSAAGNSFQLFPAAFSKLHIGIYFGDPRGTEIVRRRHTLSL